MAATSEEARSEGWQEFPSGLKVLVVDDDPLCLKVVEHMLRRCNYQVTTCPNGKDALSILRDKDHHYDLVLSDVYMPDMDGFKLLEHIGLELDLPVIMMSSNGETNVVLRGVTHGAVDFLIKPVRIEELRNVWQHVVRRRRDQVQGPSNSGDEDGDDSRRSVDKKRKDRKDDDDGNTLKKPRVVWSVEMHQQFVNAVNSLSIDKAVPKRILDLMNVEGLTRENVASHLQKYRLYLKRVSGVQTTHTRVKGGKGISAEASFAGMMGSSMGNMLPAPQQALNPMQQMQYGGMPPMGMGMGGIGQTMGAGGMSAGGPGGMTPGMGMGGMASGSTMGASTPLGNSQVDMTMAMGMGQPGMGMSGMAGMGGGMAGMGQNMGMQQSMASNGGGMQGMGMVHGNSAQFGGLDHMGSANAGMHMPGGFTGNGHAHDQMGHSLYGQAMRPMGMGATGFENGGLGDMLGAGQGCYGQHGGGHMGGHVDQHGGHPGEDQLIDFFLLPPKAEGQR